ncbi:MAG: hypothetical protein ACI4R8_04275 [Candidatus Caccovivens sp.]
MSIKKQIDSIKSEIYDIKREIDNLDDSIRESKFKKDEASSNEIMGISFMGNSSLRPLGAYTYVSNSTKKDSLSSDISILNSEKGKLQLKLDSKTRELNYLQQQYQNLPEAKLVICKNKIYIDGDESKRDIVAPLITKLNEYVDDYETVVSSEQVTNYIKLREELEKKVDASNLPKATKENISELKKLQFADGVKKRAWVGCAIKGFDYFIIGDKILVDSDFASKLINIEKNRMAEFQDEIDNMRKKINEFKPSFWSKIFKNVGKKQKDEIQSYIKITIPIYTDYYQRAEGRLKYDIEIKEKYIDSATEEIQLLDTIKRLVDSSPVVSKYVKYPDKYQQDLSDKKTIEGLVADNISTIIKDAQSYLDKNDLILSKKSVLNAIFSYPYYEHLTENLKIESNQTKSVKRQSNVSNIKENKEM